VPRIPDLSVLRNIYSNKKITKRRTKISTDLNRLMERQLIYAKKIKYIQIAVTKLTIKKARQSNDSNIY
jgi:hypothetical protein